jgi:Tannase and feruloyl esterase
MRIAIAALSTIALVTAMSTRAGADGLACDALVKQALPNTTVTSAQLVAAGQFAPPGANPAPPGNPSPFANLPAFCRVAATLTPSTDSDIKIEVWMPAAGWNGKFLGVGNGGWSGNISYGPLAAGLRRGYAAASTDTGHSGGSANFALGHPEKLIDFAWRSVHEMTVQAKAIVAAFYGNGPRLSYWTGCSSGGKQGLKEAQRFPADYDGIVAGAPANFWTHLMVGGLWIGHATLKDPASYIPREKYALIHKAALEACDANDGVKDGVLEDPARCRFDPKALLCAGDDGPTCLTAPQVEAAKKIYTGATHARTGKQIFPGLEPGSELGWAAMAGGPDAFPIVADHFKYVVFKDPSWNFKTLNFDADVDLADNMDNGLLNAIDPNLKPFFGRRGKLLLYHGWNDQLIAPRNTINYYTSVVTAVGSAASSDSIQLFMAPGANHCGGGEGPSNFDALSAIEQWVEKGKAPTEIIASHMSSGVADRTRPLCPYPQIAQYKGTGSTDDAASFACRVP